MEPPRALSRRRAVPPHPSHDPRRPHERVAAATGAPASATAPKLELLAYK